MSTVALGQPVAKDKQEWYAMRATYGRVLKAMEVLLKHQLETFVPLAPQKIGVKETSSDRLLVRDLVFVKASFVELMAVKREVSFLHFMMDACSGSAHPMVIPERQMNAFRLAVDHYHDDLRYASPEDINLKSGAQVRIHGGVFDQQEAYFVKVRGARAKRLCLRVGGLMIITLKASEFKFVEILHE